MARTIFRFLNRTGSNLTFAGTQGNAGWENNRTPPATIPNNNQGPAIFISNLPVPASGNSTQFGFRYRLPANAQPPNGEFRFTVTLFHNRIETVSNPPGTHTVNSQTSGNFPNTGFSATLN